MMLYFLQRAGHKKSSYLLAGNLRRPTLCPRPGRDADLTPPSNAEVKKELSHTSTHSMGPPGPVTGFPLPFTYSLSIYLKVPCSLFMWLTISLVVFPYLLHSHSLILPHL